MLKSDDLLQKPVLVIGAGSIGERHIRNLWTCGFRNIYVFRQRNLPFRDIGRAKVEVLLSWEDVVAIKPFAACITSPTSKHIKQAIECAKLGAHLLIEKPLSHTTEHIEELRQTVIEKGVYLRVAYMLRFHPLIQRLKEIINHKTYGKLLSFSGKWGDYMPGWHPWEDYRTTYAAQKELGGGVALTLSHDIDMVNWLNNSPVKKYSIHKNYNSDLEMDVEGGADILLTYQNGVTGHLHLNYYEKTPERYLRLVFDDASIVFSYFNNQVMIKKSGAEPEYIIEKAFDRNDMFIAQTEFFFKKISDYTVDESLKQINESELIISICNE